MMLPFLCLFLGFYNNVCLFCCVDSNKMGVTVSRMMSRATPATPNTIDGINAAEIEMNSSTQGHGTYFGPLFVVDGNAGRLMNSSRGQTGQAFWDEILNILSGGPGGLNDLAGFGNIYNQVNRRYQQSLINLHPYNSLPIYCIYALNKSSQLLK